MKWNTALTIVALVFAIMSAYYSWEKRVANEVSALDKTVDELTRRVEGLESKFPTALKHDKFDVEPKSELIPFTFSGHRKLNRYHVIEDDDYFCFFTKIGGNFNGYGEWVKLYQHGGVWYLDGESIQQGDGGRSAVQGEITCVQYKLKDAQ